MNYNLLLLFYLLRIGLGLESKHDFSFTEKPDWKFIFKLSSEQGILALIYDGLDYLLNNNLITKEMLPSRDLNMQWGVNVMNIESLYAKQFKLASEIADINYEEGIRTVVLKGIALAILYPKPNHRPCGDFDCFLMGEFDKGNEIARKHGADVDCSYYRHSHIVYKGLVVENHQFCTIIKGPEKRKVFERILQKILKENENTSIYGTKLLSPCPFFNALFLTIHSWKHFTTESISLRHICDWAILLKHHCSDIDWQSFKEIVSQRDSKMLLFAHCISYISHNYMGAPMPCIFKDDSLIENITKRVLHSVLYDPRYDPLNGKNFLVRKYLRTKKFFCGDWKYNEFSEDSRFIIMYNKIRDYFCEKNPHL